MTIDSYGGNPDIIATRSEIQRVAYEIKMAAEQLASFDPIDSILSDPIHQLQYRVSTINVLGKLERLYRSCLIAGEQYFSTEAQINRRFEVHFIPELAAITSGLASKMGWKLDQSVSATQVKVVSARAPGSITEMLNRLWQLSSKTEPTIGIDFFQNSDDKRTAVVYIPGTQTLGFGEGANPLDMQSNILAMANGGSAASERAVLEAMKQAGVSASDSVIFVGHSQGGMVAGNLTENPAGYIAAGPVSYTHLTLPTKA